MDRAEIVSQAVKLYGSGGGDFAGAVIERISVSAGCAVTMASDAGAAKSAGMTMVP